MSTLDPDAADGPPNVVFILSDQLQVGGLGCYGNKLVKTPNIDRLAESGIRFDRHYVTSPICMPSRASLWTGQYPHQADVLVNDNQREVSLKPNQHTLGGSLKARGYTCGYFGKWHLGRERTPQHGYTDAWWTALRGSFEQDVEESLQWTFESDRPKLDQKGALPFELSQDTVATDMAIDFIRDNRSNPFHVVLSMDAPHDPYTGPYDDVYDPAGIPLPDTAHEDGRGKPRSQHDGIARAWYLDAAKEVGASGQAVGLQGTIARYWGLVKLIDENVGRILRELESLSLVNDTIVVFTSDHGDMMGAHGLLAKGNFLYDEVQRVPWLISWPGRIPDGKVVPSISSAVDVVPTLLDLVGVPQPAAMPGMSARTWWDAPFNVRREAFCLSIETYGSWSPIVGITTDRWRFNWYMADNNELYDLAADPGETTNLASDPDHRDVIQGLQDRIGVFLEESGDIPMSRLARLYRSYRSSY